MKSITDSFTILELRTPYVRNGTAIFQFQPRHLVRLLPVEQNFEARSHLSGYSLLRDGAGVRHDYLVDEGTETEAEVGREHAHLVGETLPHPRQGRLVVFHGLRQVHEVVQVDGVVFGLRVEHVKVVGLVWKEMKKKQTN